MQPTVSFLKLSILAILLAGSAAIVERPELFAAQLTLSWADNANNEDGIRVERKVGTGGNYTPLASLPANAVGYVDAGLANSTTYCYRVNAFNSTGSSGYSNEACGTTAGATYTLSISKAGAGSGTVTGTGINCGSDCNEAVNSGSQVALTATPAAGSSFAGWSGAGCSGTVTVTANMTCTATFNLVSYTFTVVKAGTGSGTVTATGINCGSDCSEAVNSGAQVALTATPAAGSSFAGWSGAGCSSTVTVTANMTCTATFNLVSYTFTVVKAGTGSGTVTATGINCGSDCSQAVNSGAQVALTATPAAGSSFAGWSGAGCSGTVTVTANMTCTATFNLVSYTFTVVKAGTGSGTVTATGINCGSDCSEAVNSGAQVALTATPAAGSSFAGWSGAGCSSTVTVTANMTCTATFNLVSYTFTVVKAGTGSGTVTATGINCGSDCSEAVNSGSQVALTATPAAGSSFVGWSGAGCTGTVTVTGNMTCTATFNLTTYTLTVVKAGTGSGTVTATGINCGSDCSQAVNSGSQVALTATPAAGSSFAGWSGAGCSSTVTVTGNMTCTATFNDSALMDRVGLYRPSTGEWFFDLNGNSLWEGCQVDFCVQSFGDQNAMPVVGKWDDSGVSQVGLFFPATQEWYLDKNTNETWEGCAVDSCIGPFGVQGDIPVAGKWTSGGSDRLGVFRSSTGYWYLDKNGDGSLGSCRRDQCEYLSVYVNGDLPVVGDWNGNGVSELGLFRPSTGQWFLDKNGNKSWNGCNKDRCVDLYGAPADLPVVGDWSGSGRSAIGILRPSTGEWFLDYNNNGTWDGCGVDVCVVGFGAPGDVPVVGKW